MCVNEWILNVEVIKKHNELLASMTIPVILRSQILEIWVYYEENEKIELKQQKKIKVQIWVFKRNFNFSMKIKYARAVSVKVEYQSSLGIYQKTWNIRKNLKKIEEIKNCRKVRKIVNNWKKSARKTRMSSYWLVRHIES